MPFYRVLASTMAIQCRANGANSKPNHHTIPKSLPMATPRQCQQHPRKNKNISHNALPCSKPTTTTTEQVPNPNKTFANHRAIINTANKHIPEHNVQKTHTGNACQKRRLQDVATNPAQLDMCFLREIQCAKRVGQNSNL